jgi:hypothetical protein
MTMFDIGEDIVKNTELKTDGGWSTIMVAFYGSVAGNRLRVYKEETR